MKIFFMVDFNVMWMGVYQFEAEWCIYASENPTIIGSDDDLAYDQHQAIIWTNGGILLIGPLATSFSGIWMKT